MKWSKFKIKNLVWVHLRKERKNVIYYCRVAPVGTFESTHYTSTFTLVPSGNRFIYHPFYNLTSSFVTKNHEC